MEKVLLVFLVSKRLGLKFRRRSLLKFLLDLECSLKSTCFKLPAFKNVTLPKPFKQVATCFGISPRRKGSDQML